MYRVAKKYYRRALPLFNRRTLIISGLAFNLCGGTHAEAAEIRFPDAAWSGKYRALLNMTPVLVDGLRDLPGPPDADSLESRHEIRMIIQTQKRGVAEWRINRANAEINTPTGDILRSRGVIPDPRVAPTVWSLMAVMDQDISILAAKEAKRHGRLPPHVITPEISDLSQSPGLPAFPSLAFSRFSTALGLLALIDGRCQRDIEAVLSDIAESLIQSGANRPSDIAAAALLSEIYVARASVSNSIEEALHAARIEMGIHFRLEGCRLPE